MKTRTLALLLLAALTVPLASTKAENPTECTVRSATGSGSFSLADAKSKYVALHFLPKTECPLYLRHTNDHLSKASTLPNVVQVFLKPDSDAEIEAWDGKLPEDLVKATPIYRDRDDKLAEEYAVPDGYAFHGQTVHYPALILLDPTGKEVFRYVGKSDSDRYAFKNLAAKIAELTATN